MATRFSPTTNLLRKSRLFSLPSALSSPSPPPSSRPVSESDSATLPYPTRASIETPPTSLARGDWGLKRPLPAKTTLHGANRPVVRINHLDTYEHITDFHSANDHVMSLQKYQELSLPISSIVRTTPSLVGSGRHESVFESSSDNMTPQNQGPGKKSRYRFRGPWLAGLTETEFQHYLKKLRKQRPEFLKKLRQVVVESRAMEKRRELMDKGANFEESEIPTDINDAEFESVLISLRTDPSKLGPEVNKFLDLATPPKIPDRRIHLRNWTAGPSDLSSPQYAQTGPPKTHPSAGLSYLRVKAHIDNHPVAGPQQNPRPVPARLLRSRKRGLVDSGKGVVGVAGFVTEDFSASASRDFDKTRGFQQFDPAAAGGVKYWVKVDRSVVDSEGKVILRVDGASSAAKALYGMKREIDPASDRFKNFFGRGLPRLDRLDRPDR